MQEAVDGIRFEAVCKAERETISGLCWTETFAYYRISDPWSQCRNSSESHLGTLRFFLYIGSLSMIRIKISRLFVYRALLTLPGRFIIASMSRPYVLVSRRSWCKSACAHDHRCSSRSRLYTFPIHCRLRRTVFVFFKDLVRWPYQITAKFVESPESSRLPTVCSSGSAAAVKRVTNYLQVPTKKKLLTERAFQLA